MLASELCEVGLECRIQTGGAELIDSIADQWLKLCRRESNRTPFNHPLFIAANLKSFDAGQRFVLATVHRGDQLQAAVPLVERKSSICGLPVKKLSGAANSNTARFDIALAPGAEGDEAIAEIWRSLKAMNNWDVIELPFVPRGGSAERLLETAEKDGFRTGLYPASRSPFIAIDATGDSAKFPGRAHFLRNLRRRMRKAEQIGALRMTVSRGSHADLRQFYELESSGWKGEKGTAILSSEMSRCYFDEIASNPGIQSEVYILYFGDQAVAGKLSLVCDGRMYNLKCGYDERFREYGPGHILMEMALREITQRGFREFDFCGAWMEWKAEWTPLVREHSFCYIFRNGIYGRALFTAKMKLMAAAQRIARDPAVADFRKRIAARFKR